MFKNYYIYALIDPRDKSVFYIGKTRRSPLIRLDEHLQDSEGMSPKQERIREIYNSNAGLPDLVVLEDNIKTDKSAFTREIFWIEMFSMVGAKLTNASVDYEGVYFLADYHLNSLSDNPADLNDKAKSNDVPKDKRLSWEIELKPIEQKACFLNDDFSDEEYFQMELCKSFSPTNERMLHELAQRRSQNIASGRQKNHGFPVTDDEISLLIMRIKRGDTVRQLVDFFQRSEGSIRSILRQHGYSVEFRQERGVGYIILLT